MKRILESAALALVLTAYPAMADEPSATASTDMNPQANSLETARAKAKSKAKAKQFAHQLPQTLVVRRDRAGNVTVFHSAKRILPGMKLPKGAKFVRGFPRSYSQSAESLESNWGGRGWGGGGGGWGGYNRGWGHNRGWGNWSFFWNFQNPYSYPTYNYSNPYYGFNYNYNYYPYYSYNDPYGYNYSYYGWGW